MDSESQWLINRSGAICGSDLHLLMSSSGKFTAGNISYLYSLEWQRNNKRPKRQVDSPAMRFGRESEPYAFQWLKSNTDYNLVYVADYPKEKTFIKKGDRFGSTPDVFRLTPKAKKPETWEELFRARKRIIEIKTVYGDEELFKMFSTSLPYEKKRDRVLEQHLWQIVAQFISCADVNYIEVLKYAGQRDDDDFDTIDPLDPSRGILFEFSRKELQEYLDIAGKRITFTEEYLSSGKCLDDINEAWQNLTKKEKEDANSV